MNGADAAFVIENCAIATMDAGPAPAAVRDGARVDPVVERGELRTADLTAAARDVRAARRALAAAR